MHLPSDSDTWMQHVRVHMGGSARAGARAHGLCARVVGCTAGCWLAYCLPARSIGKSSQLVAIPTADGLIPTADGYGWNVASASTCVSSWPDESEAKTPIAAMATSSMCSSSMVRYQPGQVCTVHSSCPGSSCLLELQRAPRCVRTLLPGSM
jgi:hypothetical protein